MELSSPCRRRIRGIDPPGDCVHVPDQVLDLAITEALEYPGSILELGFDVLVRPRRSSTEELGLRSRPIDEPPVRRLEPEVEAQRRHQGRSRIGHFSGIGRAGERLDLEYLRVPAVVGQTRGQVSAHWVRAIGWGDRRDTDQRGSLRRSWRGGARACNGRVICEEDRRPQQHHDDQSRCRGKNCQPPNAQPSRLSA